MTVLPCDLGGTRMKIGVVREGCVLAQTAEPANSKAGLAPGLPALKSAWLRLPGKLKLPVRDCAGISVAFPSLVDVKSGRVLAEYGKYADAMGLDLRAWPPANSATPPPLVAGEWLVQEQLGGSSKQRGI